MSDYTYENKDISAKLETWEWDHVWWEHAATDDVPRVLYIGDSISCGTRRLATSAANGEIFFDGFGTSKAVDNPYFADSLRMFAKQQGKRQAILFNNGLHGWHLDDTGAYKQHYEKMIRFLLDEFKGTPLLLVLTTYTTDLRTERTRVRNQVVCELAQKYGLPVVDFYTVSKEHADLLTDDGVHFKKEGYRYLAETLVKAVREVIF